VHARLREVYDLVEKVRPIVETYGTAAQMVLFYTSIATMNFRRERYVISEESLASAEAALKACQQAGNASLIAQAQFTYAFCKTWHDELEEGEVQFHAGLQTAERIGDAVLQAQCLTYLGIALRRLGQIEETGRVSSQALAKATEVQRPEYIGMATSNLGWVAWRLGNVGECREKCLAALELWRPLPLKYPFTWTALLPLMSVALIQQQLSEAIEYARMLLEPHQQRLPDTLTVALEAAIQAWEANQPDSARLSLEQAITLAQETTYL
jgi:tetratricopeptide (TPR) repeat protein